MRFFRDVLTIVYGIQYEDQPHNTSGFSSFDRCIDVPEHGDLKELGAADVTLSSSFREE